MTGGDFDKLVERTAKDFDQIGLSQVLFFRRHESYGRAEGSAFDSRLSGAFSDVLCVQG